MTSMPHVKEERKRERRKKIAQNEGRKKFLLHDY